LETTNVEYQLIRTIDPEEAGEKNFWVLKVGIYFLIKKEFSIGGYNLSDNSDKNLIIYYQPIFEIKEKHDGINLRFFQSSSYENPGWSATFHDSTIESFKQIKFAKHGVFDVKEDFENKGLGSYLLDSLLLWSQKQSLTAKVDIERGGVPSEDENYKQKIKHFYDKRNIHNGISIGETIPRMEDTQRKIEETNPDEAIIKLVKIISQIEEEIRSHKRDSENSCKSYERDLAIYNNKEILYHVLIIGLGISLLLLCFVPAMIVKVKFFLFIFVCIVFAMIFVLRFLLC
jgi:hypothetical protein